MPLQGEFIANAPIYAKTIFFVGFKIDVAQAVTLPAPSKGAAIALIPSPPIEAFLFCVRMVHIVYKKYL